MLGCWVFHWQGEYGIDSFGGRSFKCIMSVLQWKIFFNSNHCTVFSNVPRELRLWTLEAKMYGLKSYFYHLLAMSPGKFLISAHPSFAIMIEWAHGSKPGGVFDALIAIMQEKRCHMAPNVLYRVSLCTDCISQAQLRKHNLEPYWSLWSINSGIKNLWRYL